MDRTPEQEAADDALAAAVTAAADAYGHIETAEFIGSFVVVAHIANVDDPTLDAYAILHPNGHQPKHVARGLLLEGETALDDGDDE